MVYTSDMWAFLLSAAIILVLIIITWYKRQFTSGRAFLYLMFCAFIWSITFAFEIAANSLELKIFIVKLQFIAITFLPLAWLNLILTYTGQIRPLRFWLYLSVMPFITNTLIWIVPRPNWFWGEPRLLYSNTMLLVDYDYGFWFYYVHALYSYILIFAALITLMRVYFRLHSIYRPQIILLIIAIFIPLIADILYVAGHSPSPYNTTTAVFSISCIIITWALFRYKFLDLLPMARDVVFENMDDGVIVLDDKNRVVDINPSAIEITGMSKQDIGLQIDQVSPGLISSTLKEAGERDTKHLEVKLENKDCVSIYDFRISSIKDQMGHKRGSLVTLRDCTERTRLIERLRDEAIRDSLTGIFNRRQLIELGQKELNRLKRYPDSFLAVILMDIDKFKNINDKYGHATGDQVLVAFTEQCKECIRPYDIFGRLGGEEFIIILPETRLEDAVIVAKRINKSIEEMQILTMTGDTVSITVSIGVVSSQALDSFELGLERLFIMADEVMYLSKKQGGNSVVSYK